MNKNAATEATIPYPSEYNFRQSINDCGPYAAAAVIRIMNKEKIDSQDIVKEIPLRLPNGYTLPSSLEALLTKHHIEVRGESFTSDEITTDEQRLEWLKWHISLGQPVIVLGKEKGAQHYITLLGYHERASETTFDVYDSWHTKGVDGLTVDDNDDVPGNKTLSQVELMEFWRGGGMFGLYKYYAIPVWGALKI